MTKRTRNLYDPRVQTPYKLSRSRLENFIRCARCFYLDRRLGVDRPSTPGFTLNMAVDVLLKKEFDIYRTKREPHPLMKENGVDAVPFRHRDLDVWRENFKGLEYFHKPTNLIFHGAIDDLWVNPAAKLIVVDYKATSKVGEISLDDDKWKDSYKRQIEIYQWILRGMGFDVIDTAYFVYANARKDPDDFNSMLRFHIQLIRYLGNGSWVETAVRDAWACLQSETLPDSSENCEYCAYRRLIQEFETGK